MYVTRTTTHTVTEKFGLKGVENYFEIEEIIEYLKLRCRLQAAYMKLSEESVSNGKYSVEAKENELIIKLTIEVNSPFVEKLNIGKKVKEKE